MNKLKASSYLALGSKLEIVRTALSLLLRVLQTHHLVGSLVEFSQSVSTREVGNIARRLTQKVQVVRVATILNAGLFGQAPELQQLSRVVAGFTDGCDEPGVVMGEFVGGYATFTGQMSRLKTAKGDFSGLVDFGEVTEERAVAWGEGEVLEASRLTRFLNVENLVSVRVANAFESGVGCAAGVGDELKLADVNRGVSALENGHFALDDGLSEVVSVKDTRKDRGRGSANGKEGRKDGSCAETHLCKGCERTKRVGTSALQN